MIMHRDGENCAKNKVEGKRYKELVKQCYHMENKKLRNYIYNTKFSFNKLC